MVGAGTEKDIKELVIARLETLNPDSKLLLLGKSPMTVKDILGEVKKDSPLGKQIVHVQFSYLKMLTSGGLDY